MMGLTEEELRTVDEYCRFMDRLFNMTPGIGKLSDEEYYDLVRKRAYIEGFVEAYTDLPEGNKRISYDKTREIIQARGEDISLLEEYAELSYEKKRLSKLLDEKRL